MLDGVTVAMSVMAAALPVFLCHGESGEGRLDGCRRHHGDDGTRSGGKCRGPAGCGAAAVAVLRCGAGSVGLGAAAGGGDVVRPGGVLPEMGERGKHGEHQAWARHVAGATRPEGARQINLFRASRRPSTGRLSTCS